jgi:glycosyltransferase involved in cell wall biosynthesis
MRTTCIINNYNYGAYVGEAIESVFNQSTAFDEIVVVDDGSTDNSVGMIEKAIAPHQGVKVIAKRNQGQLSCFNDGYAASSGDLIFFLDSDDAYKKNYLECALDLYQSNAECDFAWCAVERFGRNRGVRHTTEGYCRKTGDVGYSVASTLFMKKWVGGPTSAISMKRHVLDKILPIPFLQEWRTRADDCLVYGASLVGARKYYLAKPLVNRRTHDENSHFGKRFNKNYKYARQLAQEQLFWFILAKNNLPRNRLYDLVLREFRQLPSPDYELFKLYRKILLASDFPVTRKCGKVIALYKSFLIKKHRNGA